jgi:hypothetical protein
MSIRITEWAAGAVIARAKEAALDGLEEWAKGEVLSEMKRQCPVDQGTMRNSLGTERDDARGVIVLGGGGPAESYIYRQHQDASLNHTTGKSHFIVDPVEQLAPNAAKYVEKHLRKT